MERENVIEYNGWNGNGDSLASARLTWLTACWLSNEPDIEETVQRLALTHEDETQAADAVQQFIEGLVIGKQEHTSLATALLKNILHYEINWHEIVAGYRDDPSHTT